MSITNGLITADEYASYTGVPVPSGDRGAQWDDAITVASRWVERYCGREFHQTTSSARYFDSRDGVLVHIDDAISVSAIAVDSGDDGNYSTTVTAYQLLPHGGRDPLLGAVPYSAVKALSFTTWPMCNDRQGSVKVTGLWGWSTVPDDVKRATAILTQDLLRDPESNFGGLTVAGDGIVLGARIPARVIGLLAGFVRLERTVGMA